MRSNAAPGMRRLENVNMNCINLPEATAAVFASCARPGKAGQGRAAQGRPRPVLALQLFGFGLQRAQKRRRHRAEAGGNNSRPSPARWRWCEPQLVRPWEIYDQEVLALALAVALENANRMWRHQSSAHLLCRR